MQARLQVCSGSSMSTIGTRLLPAHQFRSCHLIMSVATWSGNRMGPSGESRRGARLDPERGPLGPQECGEKGSETALGGATLPREPDDTPPEPGPRRERREGPGDPRLAGGRIHEGGGEGEVPAQPLEHDPQADERGAPPPGRPGRPA